MAVDTLQDTVASATENVVQDAPSSDTSFDQGKAANEVKGDISDGKSADDSISVDSLEREHESGAYRHSTWANRLGVLKGWLSGNAGTAFDGWLMTCSAQIGQVMLALPNAFAKTGFIAGLTLSVTSGLISAYTLYLLVFLYEERRFRMMKAGTWDKASRHITQYHDVISFLTWKWLGIVAQIFVIINVYGICIAQVIANAADAYYWNVPGWTKRDWAFLFGGLMQFVVLVPNFRHTRIINIIGLVGTTYTTWFIVAVTAPSGYFPGAATIPPKSLQNFYTGLGVMLLAFGGHNISLEIMDAQDKPAKYRKIAFLAFAYVFSLTLPHSISVSLTHPLGNLKFANVYGVIPPSAAKDVSIALMIIHQFCAFLYYSSPLFYMWEKLFGIHERHILIKAAARLPITLSAYLLGLLFPFYGTFNSIIGSLCGPIISFSLPCIAFNLVYWKKENRERAPLKPPKFLQSNWGYNLIFLINWFIAIVYLVNGTGLGLFFSIKTFVNDVKNYSVFASCYQCPKTVVKGF